MKTRSKILLGIAVAYILAMVVVVLAFGATRRDNEEFLPQNEFKLDTWISLPGPFDINKAVLYLVIAGLLTVFTMLFVARRMQQRPNRVQTFVEVVYTAMRDNITKANMSDQMAAKWFPFIGALFLFIWYSNLIGYLPLPTSHETFEVFGIAVPSFALFAATANLSIPLVLALVVFVSYTYEGIRAKGLGGYLKGLVPGGITGFAVVPLFLLEVLSNFMRIISLSVRLFANILAGHLIILFMSGGLAVLLGLEVLGIFTLPFGVLLFMFELGLVATLQAFIFATLSAIYLGGAVAESH
jgi:F-type H+-transporting ATPase subunit a